MKIAQRIIVINFAIVVLVLGAVGFILYSTIFNVFKEQQEKQLLSAANDFLFTLQNEVEKTEESFKYIQPRLDDVFKQGISPRLENLSFVFKVTDDSLIFPQYSAFSSTISSPEGIVKINDFFDYNANIIVKRYYSPAGVEYYYGLQLTDELLNAMSLRIKADIAVFVEGNIFIFSNEKKTQDSYYLLLNAYDELRKENNFSVFSTEASETYFVSTIYTLIGYFQTGKRLDILIFSTRDDAIQLRDTLSVIIIIIAIAGIIISFILAILFTSKLRKQISNLSQAAEKTRTGNFQTRLQISEKNELGELAEAFNRMLDELEKRDLAQQEYLEFIALINQSPTLIELGNSVLERIIHSSGYNIGALYTVEGVDIEQVCAFGLQDAGENTLRKTNALKYVAESGEQFEMVFDQNAPVLSLGMVEIKISYLLIFPIVFNSEVIALLELGAVEQPKKEVKQYLKKIEQQLAVGLANAIAFRKLEVLVEELQQLNTDYQKQNRQITQQNQNLLELHRELQEKAEELEIQKRKAEESTTLKTRFLALISHELKTPLNAILGLTELVAGDESIRKKNRNRLEVVLKSGKRLLNLINDILDISKIEAGRMEVREVHFYIDDLIEEVVEQVKPLADEKGLKFNLKNTLNKNYLIAADRGKVLQILLNLLGNAIKFTEEGFVVFNISLHMGNSLIFEVIDSGIGISSDEQKQIFEEFRQADGSSNRKYSGTGLGLAISKRFAKLLKGEIELSSTENEGSKFSFILPVTILEEKETGKYQLAEYLNAAKHDAEELESIEENEAEDESKGFTILIVDDDPDTLFTLNEILSEEHFLTLSARDGAECLNILKRGVKPDIILLDIMMPVMNGFQTIKQIRRDFSGRELPVLAITARAMLEDSETIYKYGFNGLIPKPINRKTLLENIKEYISPGFRE